MQRVLAGLFALSLGSACTTEVSDDIATRDMDAKIVVTHKGGATADVSVTLRKADTAATFIDLANSDKLEATHSAETHELTRTSLLGFITYATTFSAQPADAAAFVVSFTRTGSFPSAPSSSAELPVPFTLGAINDHGAQGLSRAAEDLVLTWTSDISADTLELLVAGTCFDNYTRTLDPQTLGTTVTRGTLRKASGDQTETCDATVTLTRSRPGTLDPAFGGGSVRAEQVRAATFKSAP
ncbi:MAG: hypothetical protein HY904_23225 [Deltaproteobacteria bacterium]|nr:hypothetical protein [Deltaproteobacteria bacterium]